MKDYEVIKGKTDYLFSAPHAHPHRRPSLARKFKEYEEYTDDLVKEICQETNSWGIYVKSQLDYDPNFHKASDNPYKKEIKRIIEGNNIKYFMDIHGLSDEHMIDVAIYYKTRFFNSIRLAKKVYEELNKGKLEGLNIQIFRLPEDKRESLTEFSANKLRIPSVQIEIAKYLRKEKDLRSELVKNFVDIVS
jgi:DNA primase large subunit